MSLIKKTFLISLVLAPLLHADNKIEVVAKSVEQDNNIITATGDAVAVGKGYFIRADKLIYNKTDSTAEGFGHIFALKDSSLYTISDYVKFYLDEKRGYFDKFFLEELKSNVWISSKEAAVKNKVYTANSAVSSSCNIVSPDWYLSYDEGEFDSGASEMTLKNATLYIKGAPILYSPYFSFSTDKTRRSGLLKPDIGIKGNEGFIFMQPYYYTPSPDAPYDNEFAPQIRTKRGYGFSDTFRFITSEFSRGYIKGGYFRDKESFRKEYALKYGSHYGLTLFYESEKLFSSKDKAKDEEDGLYVNLNYLNDIDYVNLQARDILRENNSDKITTSKINYYFRQKNNYFGAYMKYYIDTSKTSNDDTVQEYPKLQYHRNSESLFFDDLLYSFDVTSLRYDRRTGLNALQTQAFLPITYTMRFFDDFVGFSLAEHFYANKVGFSNSQDSDARDYSFASITHKAKIFTTLQKKYDDFIHTIDFELLYSKSGAKQEKNYPTQKNELTTLVTSSSENENSSIKLAQFFYDKKGALTLSHRLSQAMYHNVSRVDYKYGDLENEIVYRINKNTTLSTDIFYSYKNSIISAATSSIGYNDGDLGLSVSHVYKDKNATLSLLKEKESYFAASASKKIDRHYTAFGGYEYDENKRETRAWNIGLSMKKQCINYSISLKNEITPILTSAESSSIRNYIIYFSINLIPLGGLNQSYSISNKK